MKLTTILTSGYPLSEKLNRMGEWAMRGIAHHLPRRLAYWSLIDSGVRHIRGDEVVPDVTFLDVLERAGKGNES